MYTQSRYNIFLLLLLTGNVLFADFQFENLQCPNKPDAETQALLKTLNIKRELLNEATLRSFQANPPSIPNFVQLKEIETVKNTQIPTTTGSINVRYYFPKANNGFLPVLVFFHGGGWALGTLDEYDPLCQEICHRTPCIVASVEYRLAPKYKFPKPLEDCYEATKWIAAHMRELGTNSQWLAVGGDSAGGNLAAAVTLMAREKKAPQIDYQVLIYPILNHSFDTLSYFLFENNYYLTREMMQFFWNIYLQNPREGMIPYASPLQTPTVTNLPPALIVLANFDPLRDEGLAYAWRLQKAGIPVTVKRYDSIHGMLSFSMNLSARKKALQEIAEHLGHVVTTSSCKVLEKNNLDVSTAPKSRG